MNYEQFVVALAREGIRGALNPETGGVGRYYHRGKCICARYTRHADFRELLSQLKANRDRVIAQHGWPPYEPDMDETQASRALAGLERETF